VGSRYALYLADGEDAGEAEYGFQPGPGDVIYVEGERDMRVRAVIPIELAGEFIDGALNGVLEVEPLRTRFRMDERLSKTSARSPPTCVVLSSPIP
jgi:hypothetical protein